MSFKEKVVLAKVPFARFSREVLGGSVIIYDVEVLNLRAEGASVHGRIYQLKPGEPLTPGADQLVGEAEIFFAHLDNSRSQQVFGDHNFVFSGELKHMLGLAKVVADRSS